jgi:hypothetical protein
MFPDDNEKYADLNSNNEWDAGGIGGEAAVRDNDDNGVWSSGDSVLIGNAPPLGTVLGTPDDFEKFADITAGTMPNFHVTTREVAWGSEYLPRMIARQLPLFFMGWQADYPEPNDFAFTFMHSLGTLAKCQSFSDPRSDSLIEFAASSPGDTNPYSGQLDHFPPIPYFNNYPGMPPDTRWPKRSTYYELQWWYYDYIPSVPIAQPFGRHWEIAWVHGWYYNPLYGGSFASAIDSTAPEAPVTYFYHAWKALTHNGDANNNGAVDVADGATVSASWTKPSPTSPLGPLGYRPQADLNGDGKVNVQDVALISAYWDGPPKGPSHP